MNLSTGVRERESTGIGESVHRGKREREKEYRNRVNVTTGVRERECTGISESVHRGKREREYRNR